MTMLCTVNQQVCNHNWWCLFFKHTAILQVFSPLCRTSRYVSPL